ncbi:MAG TPA: phosphonate ABC transporter, permease protein PhnE [Casimicrobiaceae bacterium]|nr:phosphonate ABC transporter, permease protein PhnE [Casimicrobiaceae bacterium]
MSTAALGATRRWTRSSMFGSPAQRRVLLAAFAAYCIWSLTDLPIDHARVMRGFGRAADMLARMWPPDFSRWQLLGKGMLESIQMAIVSSVAGALLCLPLALCAARNLAPTAVYVVARALIVVGRTFHEVIIAILFVKLFGFGAVAGMLTLAFSSAVFLAKMIAEDIENVRPGPVEAMRATGARFGQVVVFAIAPQVIVRALGVFIYRIDANLRHSTVVGIVGAGGIGQTLAASFTRYDYDFSAAILLCIAALVAFGEWFSDWVRRRLR